MQCITVDGEKKYYFDSMDFEVNNTHFRIIASTSTGPTWIDVVHTIKNVATNETSDLNMATLIQIFKDYGKI